MRLELNPIAAKKLEEIRSQYADRGIRRTVWQEIFSQAILAVPTQKWAEFVDEHTPHSYYLKVAMSDEAMAAEIANFVRKSRAQSAESPRKGAPKNPTNLA